MTDAISSSHHATPLVTNRVGGPASASGHTDGTAALLPTPYAGDVGLAVAQMMIENAFRRRDQAREDRKVGTHQMMEAQRGQIAKLHEEAEKNFEAAQIEAWGKIAEGACGIAGGAMNAYAASGTTTETKLTDRITITTKERGPWAGSGDAMSSGGKAGAGVAGLFSANARRDAGHLAAEAKALEMEATANKRLVENADDETKEAREVTRRALDFLREFQSTNAKTMSSAIKG